MSKGKRALRYQTVDEMPPAMQRMAKAALAGDRVLFHVPRGPGKTSAAAAIEVMTAPQGTKVAEKLARKKYGNHITHVDGIRFDSKREAKYYEQLLLRQAAGEVSYFLRQVAVHMPGGTRLVVDFQEHHADGSVHYIDVKGRETPVFRLKKREIEHHYPIRIELR